jgi:hypothetical protein
MLLYAICMHVCVNQAFTNIALALCDKGDSAGSNLHVHIHSHILTFIYYSYIRI